MFTQTEIWFSSYKKAAHSQAPLSLFLGPSEEAVGRQRLRRPKSIKETNRPFPDCLHSAIRLNVVVQSSADASSLSLQIHLFTSIMAKLTNDNLEAIQLESEVMMIASVSRGDTASVQAHAASHHGGTGRLLRWLLLVAVSLCGMLWDRLRKRVVSHAPVIIRRSGCLGCGWQNPSIYITEGGDTLLSRISCCLLVRAEVLDEAVADVAQLENISMPVRRL